MLALADMIPEPGRPFRGWRQRLGRGTHYIPEANMYDRVTYRDKLLKQGFVDAQVTSIAQRVYEGCYRFLTESARRQPAAAGSAGEEWSITLSDEELASGLGTGFWHARLGTGDYVLASARKPA